MRLARGVEECRLSRGGGDVTRKDAKWVERKSERRSLRGARLNVRVCLLRGFQLSCRQFNPSGE